MQPRTCSRSIITSSGSSFAQTKGSQLHRCGGRWVGGTVTVELGEPSLIDTALDTPWSNDVRVVLVPHLQLSESRRRIVELDYGMVDGEAVVECRQALLFYMLKHLGLNQPQGGSLTKQVALKNEAELRALLPATSE